jgi:predicted aspartyl protease
VTLSEVAMAQAMIEGREHTLAVISKRTGIRQDVIGHYWREKVKADPRRWIVQGGAK